MGRRQDLRLYDQLSAAGGSLCCRSRHWGKDRPASGKHGNKSGAWQQQRSIGTAQWGLDHVPGRARISLYTVVYKVLQASISCTNGGSSCTILVWEFHRVSVCARIMYQTWQQSCKNRARCGAEFLHLAAQPSFQFYMQEAGPDYGSRVAKISVIGATSAHTENATASFHSPPVMSSVAAQGTEDIAPEAT